MASATGREGLGGWSWWVPPSGPWEEEGGLEPVSRSHALSSSSSWAEDEDWAWARSVAASTSSPSSPSSSSWKRTMRPDELISWPLSLSWPRLLSLSGGLPDTGGVTPACPPLLLWMAEVTVPATEASASIAMDADRDIVGQSNDSAKASQMLARARVTHCYLPWTPTGRRTPCGGRALLPPGHWSRRRGLAPAGR